MSVINSYDASRAMVEVFDKEGNGITVSRLNATDLVRTGNYHWAQPSTANTTAPEAVDSNITVLEVVDPDEYYAESEQRETLAEEAKRVIGNYDVDAYLETFSVDVLRNMAEERYGEKVHARTGKDKMVVLLKELEEKRLISELDD